MRPELTLQITDDGTHILNIIPNTMWGAKEKSITITRKEAEAIHRWRLHHGVIQKYLPDWPVDKRELLLTGMDAAEWDAYMGGDDDKEAL